jgi:hypothetical protein
MTNSKTSTGLTSVNELTHSRRIRDTNKLTSESSSLNLKPRSNTLFVRSHISKLFLFNKNKNKFSDLFRIKSR